MSSLEYLYKKMMMGGNALNPPFIWSGFFFFKFIMAKNILRRIQCHWKVNKGIQFTAWTRLKNEIHWISFKQEVEEEAESGIKSSSSSIIFILYLTEMKVSSWGCSNCIFMKGINFECRSNCTYMNEMYLCQDTWIA